MAKLFIEKSDPAVQKYILGTKNFQVWREFQGNQLYIAFQGFERKRENK